VSTIVTIEISEELSTQLAPYRDNVDDLLRIGLRGVKMAEGLALFKEGDLSLWKAARLAGVSLREMIQYAVAQGLRPTIDEETLQEELA
jgi:hypothetical protein